MHCAGLSSAQGPPCALFYFAFAVLLCELAARLHIAESKQHTVKDGAWRVQRVEQAS